MFGLMRMNSFRCESDAACTCDPPLAREKEEEKGEVENGEREKLGGWGSKKRRKIHEKDSVVSTADHYLRQVLVTHSSKKLSSACHCKVFVLIKIISF